MSDSLNNNDQVGLLDAALRRDVPPEEPLSPQLQARIVALIRAESSARRGVATLRRFAIGGALAAGVLLAIAFLVMNRAAIDSPGPIVSRGSDESIFANIPPAPAIMDDSLAAVEEFATESVVQEMRHLARDASEIGSAMLASLPIDVAGEGQLAWWTRLLDK